MMNTVIPFPTQTQADVSHETRRDADADDDLGCARGLIYWTPVSLLMWGFIIGALMWVI